MLFIYLPIQQRSEFRSSEFWSLPCNSFNQNFRVQKGHKVLSPTSESTYARGRSPCLPVSFSLSQLGVEISVTIECRKIREDYFLTFQYRYSALFFFLAFSRIQGFISVFQFPRNAVLSALDQENTGLEFRRHIKVFFMTRRKELLPFFLIKDMVLTKKCWNSSLFLAFLDIPGFFFP